LQQNDSPAIRSRLVFHFGGYEPVPPIRTYRRFIRELQRFQQTWSVTSSASAPVIATDRANWVILSNGPNWTVKTDHQLFRWDDIMAGYADRPTWWRLPIGLLAFIDFVVGGALWGYARTSWRYALFFLYPYLLLLMMVLISCYAGELAARATGSIAIGIAAAVLAFILLYFGTKRWTYVSIALDDWIFSRRISEAGIRSWSVGLMQWPRRSSQQTVPGLSMKSFCLVTVLGRCWRLTRWIGLSDESPIWDRAVLGLPW
jgi:hypothetical protein